MELRGRERIGCAPLSLGLGFKGVTRALSSSRSRYLTAPRVMPATNWFCIRT